MAASASSNLTNAAPVVDISKMFSLAGKTAIVTGATGGLGTAMTVALASAGADIVTVDLPADPASSTIKAAIQDTGRKIQQFECDIRQPVSLRGCYERIWATGIKADILLNCAGVQRRNEAVSFTDEEIEIVLDVNIKATLVSCQEFAKPLLKEGRPGKIINIASIISFIGGKNITPYAASKGAVLQVTKAFSNEWAEHGIQCNSIHPGYFRTPMTEQYATDPKYSHFNEYILGRTPQKRWGLPADLQGAVIFLASSASDYVSGTPLIVDGGLLGF